MSCGSCAAGVVVHQREGLHRSGARGSRDANEVLDTALLVFLRIRRRTVAEEFFRHEQHSGGTRRWAPQRGCALVLRRVRGLGVLAVAVVVIVEVVVFFPRMLHSWLDRGAFGGTANTRAAASVGGSGLSSGPAGTLAGWRELRECPPSRGGRRRLETRLSPLPGVPITVLNRVGQTTGEVFERGLNTEVKQSSTSAARVLVELVEGHHDRDNTPAHTQVHNPREEVKPLHPAGLCYTACRGHSTMSLPRALVWLWWIIRKGNLRSSSSLNIDGLRMRSLATVELAVLL